MENMHTDVKAQRVNDAQNENLWISNRLFSIVPEKKLSKSHLTKKTILEGAYGGRNPLAFNFPHLVISSRNSWSYNPSLASTGFKIDRTEVIYRAKCL